jgi:hypothetical protein
MYYRVGSFFRTNQVHHFDPPESQHVSISYYTSRKVRIANLIYTGMITGLPLYCSPMLAYCTKLTESENASVVAATIWKLRITITCNYVMIVFSDRK